MREEKSFIGLIWRAVLGSQWRWEAGAPCSSSLRHSLLPLTLLNQIGMHLALDTAVLPLMKLHQNNLSSLQSSRFSLLWVVCILWVQTHVRHASVTSPYRTAVHCPYSLCTQQFISLPSCPPTTTGLILSSLPIPRGPGVEITLHVAFLICLLLVLMSIEGSFMFFSWLGSSVMSSAEHYCIAWTFLSLVIHLPAEGHFGCFGFCQL